MLMQARFRLGGKKPTTSLSQQATAVSATANLTGPSTILAGDLLVFLDNAFTTGGQPTTAVPSGFTQIRADTVGGSSDSKQVMSYKIADGTEASASIQGMTATAYAKSLVVYRGDNPISAVLVASSAGQATDANPTAQVVTSSAGVAPLVVVGGYGGTTLGISPRTFTPAKDSEIQSANGAQVMDTWQAWKIYNSSLADVTIDMDDEGNDNILQSFYLQVS